MKGNIFEEGINDIVNNYLRDNGADDGNSCPRLRNEAISLMTFYINHYRKGHSFLEEYLVSYQSHPNMYNAINMTEPYKKYDITKDKVDKQLKLF